MVGRWWRGATEDSHSFIHSFLQKYAFLIRARLWWVLGIMIFNADMGAGEKVVREGISEDIDSYIGYDNDSRNATALKSLNLYIDLTYIVCGGVSILTSAYAICTYTVCIYYKHVFWGRIIGVLEGKLSWAHGSCFLCVLLRRLLCVCCKTSTGITVESSVLGGGALIASMGIFSLYAFYLSF
jgi:hypothetical protein